MSGCVKLSTCGVNIELSRIDAGSFTMGSSEGLPLEMPPHPVDICRSFYLSTYPITQQVWASVMGYNPSTFKQNPLLPVEGISWLDASTFCQQLSALAERIIRLPTEAEWEYACRAGTSGEFFFGAESETDHYGWFDMNSQDQTHPIGLKRPNPWGLYDVVGNVWEWCEDAWADDYRVAVVDGSARLINLERGLRVLRGGAWDMDAFRCRSAYRSYAHHQHGTSRFGCRIVVEC